jgi:iron complex outermembrane receptor protein
VARISACGGYRAAYVTALFGTCAFSPAALAAAAQPAPVEEVLITGSLIRGAPAVGVPVTALSNEDFKETGALTTAELLRNVPAMVVQETVTALHGGGRISYGQNVQIHGFAPGSGVETLLMVNGMRWPIQGHGGDTVDPSIVPQLAVDRIDVLAAGASATYGSDAVAGVVNVIMRRGYDGAITEGSFGASTDVGAPSYRFAQLFGTKWDSGGVTLSYEFYEQRRLPATARPYVTSNFESYLLDDRTPLAASNPGVVSLGAPTMPTTTPTGFSATIGTRFCSNCFALPKGIGWNFDAQAPGPTTTWTATLANAFVIGAANETNQRIPYMDALTLPHSQRNGATITFDQDIANDIVGTADLSFFGEAFYSNRRSVIWYHAVPGSGNAQTTLSPAAGLTVPTNNPYRPTGAPANIRVHYTLGPENPVRIMGSEIARRYAMGFNLESLPFDWRGRAYYSMTEDQNSTHTINMINRNMVLAALGNTVASVAASGTVPGQAAFTKPANVPYLNVFCDATIYQCNSPTTLRYIRGFRDRDEHWQIAEWGALLDGPAFELPGGEVRGAVGAQKLSHHFRTLDNGNGDSVNLALIASNAQYEVQRSWSVFGQVNVPLVGGDFTLPLVEALELEAGYRYDHYNTLGGVKTPKIGANWTVGYGLVVRGTWGKAFRAPSFAEGSELAGARVREEAAGAQLTNCASVNGSPVGVAIPGSLTAVLNPTCNPALNAPLGLEVAGGSGAAAAIRATVLGPESSRQWVVGLNFQPMGFLRGLNIDVSMFHMRVEDLIAPDTSGLGPNDPASFHNYIVIPNPNLPATDPANASFLALILALQQSPASTLDPANIPNFKFIHDNANTNIGYAKFSGVDFDTRYDWDLGNWGSWNIGASGYYELNYQQRTNDTTPIADRYVGKNSGSRLKRVRARLGWTDGAWSIVAFANYKGHGPEDLRLVPPPCYWQPGFGPGSCYPGSAYFPQEHPGFTNYSPANVLFDLAVGYRTGDGPANAYLKNVGFQLAVQNLLNKVPPFLYGADRGRDWRAFDTGYSQLQRTVTFTVTKVW